MSDPQLSSVSAALSILEYLGSDPESGVNEIARSLKMPPSRAHRLLKTLLAHGFVHQDETTKQYWLGIKLFELGSSVTGQMGLRDAAYPEMKELHNQTGETVSLAILEGPTILYLERIQTDDLLVLNLPPGRRAPAHATALGKALLASLDNARLDEVLKTSRLEQLTQHTFAAKGRLRKDLQATRERGYAIDNEEFVNGFRCVAAVIWGPRKEPVGAVSVSAPAERLDEAWLETLGALVRKAADRVSSRLGVPGRQESSP